MNFMNLIQTITKNQRVISIRDFSRNLAAITNKPESKVYTIVKNGEEVGMYIPKKYAHEVIVDYDVIAEQQSKHSSFEDLQKMAIHSGEKNLSKRIDEIIYGE